VATPEDASTARKGESLYAYAGRSIIFLLIRAWQAEDRRLAGRSFLHNRVLQYGLFEAALSISVLGIWGLRGLLIYWIQSAVAVSLLTIIDYVEHYGLV